MMQTENELKKIDEKIKLLSNTAKELKILADNIPAITRNTTRLLASVKMMELNISDCIDFDILKYGLNQVSVDSENNFAFLGIDPSSVMASLVS